MKQVMRRVIDRKGKVVLMDLPEPQLGPDQVLVQAHYSLISSGTESSMLAKTPIELVKQTISDPWMRRAVQDTILAAGVSQTGRRVAHELLAPRELGYSGAGRVVAVGSHVEGIQIGNKVAYAAQGHAELATPSINHTVAVPDGVDTREAAFITVAGIALQSIRRADLRLGEVVAIYGLGLVGQVCCLLAKAAGAVVVGIDVSPERTALALKCGADHVINGASENVERRISDLSAKHGVDATIICASSKSSEIINTATKITRRQGRVVIVGYVGLNIQPKDFLHRELDIRYSRAYGPGSYDAGYEKGRVDYPFGYVRWTENRNLAEIIRLLEVGAVRLLPLIGKTYPLASVQQAFDDLASGNLPGVAALIEYDFDREPDRRRSIQLNTQQGSAEGLGITLVGCGNHVLGRHLPNLRKMKDIRFRSLVSATGKNASLVAESIGAQAITTDLAEALADPETDAVLICSNQPNHADHVVASVKAGKAVYVEKPMATTAEDLRRIADAMAEAPVPFSLGLNRRYSPLLDKLRQFIGAPVDSVQYLVAQSLTPSDHWSLDVVDGGGRLFSEGEHFIDICHAIIGKPAQSVYARALGDDPEDLRQLCNYALTMHYDGAVANIVVNESGAKGFPRERITAFGRGRMAILDDFAILTLHDGASAKRHGSKMKQQMGHEQALNEFVKKLRGGDSVSIGWEQSFHASLCMFAARDSIRSGEPVVIQDFARALLTDDEFV